MKAMVLAAGLGTRLRPITDARPKALVEIAGRTLLEITLERLKAQGVRQVIVNAHHFADEVGAFLPSLGRLGMRIELSREDDLLDTGGGLKQAEWFFLDDADTLDEPFVLHNVDVLSTIDIQRMVRFHKGVGALATLAVLNRPMARRFLFDAGGELCGWRSEARGETRLAREVNAPIARAFTGIHVLSPALLRLLPGGAFSIVDAYLELAAQGRRIAAFAADAYAWRDVGNPDDLRRARQEFGGV